MKAIILAAGYATRLYPLTRNRPKPLLPVQGKPIIDYLIEQMAQIPELDGIYVVSNDRFSAQFEQWAAARNNEAIGPEGAVIQIEVLNDGTKSEEDRLGAIGDLKFCIEHFALDDDLLVIAGDTLMTGSLLDVWRDFKKYNEDLLFAMPLTPKEDPSRFAIVQLDEQGRVAHLEEKPARPKGNLAVYAVYFYRRDTLPLVKEYLAEGNNPDAPGHFPVWLYQRKPVRVHIFAGQCVDIGTPESYQAVMTTFPVSTAGGQDENEKNSKNDLSK